MDEQVARYQKARKDAYKYGRYHGQNHETAEDFASYVCVQMARGMYKCLRYMFRDFCAKEIADLRTPKGQAKHNTAHIRELVGESHDADGFESEDKFLIPDPTSLWDIERFIEGNNQVEEEEVKTWAPSLVELDKWKGGTMLKEYLK